jgi:hypothetical protein
VEEGEEEEEEEEEEEVKDSYLNLSIELSTSLLSSLPELWESPVPASNVITYPSIIFLFSYVSSTRRTIFLGFQWNASQLHPSKICLALSQYSVMLFV